MLGAYAQSCCCGNASTCERDCIWGTEIESGCCHKDDTLLLWCERKPMSVRFNQSALIGTVLHETCCTTSSAEEPPVQAIYQYYDCFWRCVKINPALGLESIDGFPEMCPSATCDFTFDEFGDPVETDCYPFTHTTCSPCGAFENGCCNAPEYNAQPYSDNCLPCCANCNSKKMSSWRKRRMASQDRWKWFVECMCHANGLNLGNLGCTNLQHNDTVWSNCQNLYQQAICVVHFERWWKIADCDAGVRIYVPGCTQDASGNGNCGGVSFQTDDLVPKWWIFACSGIPLYAGDLIDAIRFNVVTAIEVEQFFTDLFGGECSHPSQEFLKKLAVAGYIRANDWRDEQRTAYQELNTRFPGAGYGACIQDVGSMHTLGPFRKRMTAAQVGVTNFPFLRRVDVVNSPDLAPLQADCFIPFPGGSQSDYDYWCERQWVYFRGRPGGWTWVGWAASSCGPGIDNEVKAILNGDGRGDQNCIAAFHGEPRHPPTQTPCSCCNSSNPFLPPGITVDCMGCTSPEWPLPAPNCGPPDICETTSYQPRCEGLHIKHTKYAVNSDLRTPDGSTEFGKSAELCNLCAKNRCQVTNHTFLVEARRSVDSWLDSVPFTCRNEKPPLEVFNTWPAWSKTHPAPEATICSFANEPGSDTMAWCWCATPPCLASEYTNRLCCGAMCEDYECDCVPEAVDPYSGPSGVPCPQRTDCPPFSTTEQTDCIGFTPDCTP